MKKIITSISLFLGLISNAQYIEPTRFEVDANVGYNLTFGIQKPHKNTFVNKNGFNKAYSGMVTEIAAHYRLGFASNYLIGIRFNQVKGNKEYERNYITETEMNVMQYQGSLTFIGASFQRQLWNRIGTRFITTSISPGVMFLKNNVSGITNGTVNASGLAINLSSSMGYTIYKDLLFTTNLGVDYANFSKYNLDLSKTTNSNDYKFGTSHFIRAKFAVGLRYKL